MNKTKKELYEENKKLKEQVKEYTEFWEVEAIKECKKTLINTKNIIIVIAVILLLISSFVLGLTW